MITLYAKNFKDAWFGAACNGKKVFATSFSFNQSRVLHSLLLRIPFDAPFQHSLEVSCFAEQVISTLRDIYQGKDFSKKFVLAKEHLSSYAEKVLEAVAVIPIGYVTTYGSVAMAVGGSPRAVGKVMASNPFPLIIPCHRVVSSNFSLGGYGEGLNVKQEILSRERRGKSVKREFSVNKEKIQVFPVELWLKTNLERSRCCRTQIIKGQMVNSEGDV